MVERNDRGETRRPDGPKVSIGLAVYNGERYLDEAITSILSQTFRISSS